MSSYKEKHRRRGVLAPCPEMWSALKQGHGLIDILKDFYSQVYDDDRLKPFFKGVTIQRAIEKQFSFLRSIFTGEKCYFGDHPKKAHDWMVISDELFDYREQLLKQCLLNYGLEKHLITKWLAIDEVFRSAIVKDKPHDRLCNGMRKPTQGYVLEILSVDSLCDDCGSEIRANQEIISHIRTGEVYCKHCKNEKTLKLYRKLDDKSYVAINA